jgi:hypothetical protein
MKVLVIPGTTVTKSLTEFCTWCVSQPPGTSTKDISYNTVNPTGLDNPLKQFFKNLWPTHFYINSEAQIQKVPHFNRLVLEKLKALHIIHTIYKQFYCTTGTPQRLNK